MKNLIFRRMFLGAAILPMAVVMSCITENSSAQTQPVPANADMVSSVPDDSTALPADVDPNGPLAQVIQLLQSGVDESVIMAYVTNSGSPFNLTSDQIIYLKDVGAPSELVTAMIQRDQQLGVATNTQPRPAVVPTDETAQPSDVSDDYFYDSLQPYGTWVDVSGYGLCWRPTVVIYDSSWQPYCDHGHWVYTDAGWFWYSDYSWGSIAFHYGRWFRDPRYGWCWWPDTTWGPSWVTWRYGNDYCGWAPLPPHAIYRPGLGIVYQGRNVSVGFNFGLTAGSYIFVPTRDFCAPHPRDYRVDPRRADQIYGHTTIINHFNYDSRNRRIINDGIPTRDIATATRTEIRPVTIHDTVVARGHVGPGDRFDQNNHTLYVNQPRVSENAVSHLNQGIRPRPAAPAWTAPGRVMTSPGRNNYYSPQRHESPAPQRPQNEPGQTSNFNPPVPQRHEQVGTALQRPPVPYYSRPAQSTPDIQPENRAMSPRIRQEFRESPQQVDPRPPEIHNAPAQSQTQQQPNRQREQGH